MPGYQPFFRFLHDFVLAKLAPSSIRVDNCNFHGFRVAPVFLKYCHVSARFTARSIFCEMTTGD